MSPLALDTTRLRVEAQAAKPPFSRRSAEHVAQALLDGAVVALLVAQAGGPRTSRLQAVELAAPLVELAEERLDLVLLVAAGGLEIDESRHAASFKRVGAGAGSCAAGAGAFGRTRVSATTAPRTSRPRSV